MYFTILNVNETTFFTPTLKGVCTLHPKKAVVNIFCQVEYTKTLPYLSFDKLRMTIYFHIFKNPLQPFTGGELKAIVHFPLLPFRGWGLFYPPYTASTISLCNVTSSSCITPIAIYSLCSGTPAMASGLLSS
ncbi:MAG: hypothetical protein RIR31_763 [Bacteroidota bacterium]